MRPAYGVAYGVLTLALATACATAEKREEATARARIPTLAEIFLEPSIAGRAPSFNALSADGRWLLLRWDPVVQGAGEPQPATLRLLDVLRPEDSDYRGLVLERLLPPSPEGGVETADRAVWSKAGHLLAIARGKELYLHDPASRRTELTFFDPTTTQPAAAEDANTADSNAGAHLASEIRSLAFSIDDTELRFMDAENLFGIRLPKGGFTGQTHSVADTLNRSEGLDADAHSLLWNDALNTVYGRDHRPKTMLAETGASAEELEEDSRENPAEEDSELPHVWLLDEDRGVFLEGLDDLPGVRSDRLSPDGRWVVAREVDDTNGPGPNLMPRWLDERVATREVRSQLADDLASPTALWAWTATGGARRPVEPLVSPRASILPPVEEPDPTAKEAPGSASSAEEDLEERPWVRTLGWAPQLAPNAPARYAFSILSQDHGRLETWVFTEGYSQRVWSERDPRWIGGPTRGAAWTPDGRHLILGSEASHLLSSPGRNQLFAVDADNGSARQLTDVEGEVDDFVVLHSGEVLVVASRADPRRRSIGVVAAAAVRGDEPPAVRWLPTPVGWNVAPRAGDDAALVVFRHESLFRTTELWATDGERAWVLTRTEPDSFRSNEWIRPSAVTATAPDGARVHAHVYLPPGLTLEEPGPAPRAAIVFVHGAGYLQNVTDSMTRYPLNAMFHSRLARMGYPVIDVDYRGSAGYGQSFRTDVQYHLGGKDLDDLHLIVDLLARQGVVDPERVGLYGGSYGGFLTLMALFTAPERWAAGAALRSVTDWRSYNPSYTQARLGRPSTHPEAYARSSPIDNVDGLEDPLYLFHGLEDSNVFAQDTIRLMEELIDRGLEFDAMLYPSQGHAFDDGPHWLDEYRRIEAHLLGHLGPPLSN